MKKIYGVCLILILFVMVNTSLAVLFYDVPSNHWAYSVITMMSNKGIVSGYPDGTFLPNNSITRAEFAKILTISFNLFEKSNLKFEDVSKSHWAQNYINVASSYMDHYSMGSKLFFFPDRKAVREDVIMAIVYSLDLEKEEYSYSSLSKFSDRYDISSNREKYVAIAVENNLVRGNADGTFNPKGSLTRAEVCQLIENATTFKNNKKVEVVSNDLHTHKWSSWFAYSSEMHIRYCLLNPAHNEQRPHSFEYGYCIECNYNPSIGREDIRIVPTETAKPIDNDYRYPALTLKTEGDFYYKALNNTQKKIYDEMKKACYKLETVAQLDQFEISDMQVALNALRGDFSQFFWIRTNVSYTYNKFGKVTSVSFSIPSNAKDIVDKLDAKATQIVNGITGSDYDKIKKIFEWIIDNTTYERTTTEQDAYGAILYGKAVCGGYAKAFKYLCEKMGIECAVVTGNTDRIEDNYHAWNLVKLYDKYYWVDSTWGDGKICLDDNQEESFANYNYFLVSDKDFLVNHFPDNGFRMKSDKLIQLNLSFPTCYDDSYNYFRNIGAYFDYFDTNKITNYLKDTIRKNPQKAIEIKFGNSDAYSRFIEEFFTNKKIFDVIRDAIGKRNTYVEYSYVDWEEINYLRITVKWEDV